MAWVPLANSSSSVTIHLYSHFRAYNCTEGTARAFTLGFIEGHHIVTFGVQMLSGNNESLGTELNAKGATLTEHLVYLYFASHFTSQKV